MTKPTREQILAAHYAAEQLALLATSITERHDVKDYKEMILAALPPRPQPTMAEVEWDDDKHYMAEAEVGEIKLIMLRPDLIGRIRCFDPESCKVMPSIEPEDVTPTGRRYTLTEVQE